MKIDFVFSLIANVYSESRFKNILIVLGALGAIWLISGIAFFLQNEINATALLYFFIFQCFSCLLLFYLYIKRQLIGIIISKEERLSLVFQNALSAIIIMNKNGFVVDCNPEVEKLFGYTISEVIGKDIISLAIPADKREQHKKTLLKAEKIVKRGGKIRQKVELFAICKNGKQVEVELTLVSGVQSSEIVFIAFVRDITERKQLFRTLEESLSVAEFSSKAKTDFLANMSHEIRTPMNAIMGMTEIVLDTRITNEQREYLEIVMRSSKSLLNLINQILDLSKINAGQLELELRPFDVYGLIDGVCEALALCAAQKGIRFYSQFGNNLPETLMGDSLRLRQVLINLVTNAIKFTASGEIVISIDSKKGASDRDYIICFSVIDTGIGISSSKINQIFERFTQADSSTTRKHGGTGLGLTISRRLVTLMGSELKVVSQVSVGSTFSFKVNLEICDRLDAEFKSERRRSINHQRCLTGVKVLLLVENFTSKEAILSHLKYFGANVVCCTSVDKLNKIHQGSYLDGDHDVVIIDDYVLPFIQDKQKLSRISNEQKLIVLVTLNFDSSELAKLNALQIKKPVKRFILLRHIEWIMGRISVPQVYSQEKFMDQQKNIHSLFILSVEDYSHNQIVLNNILEGVGHLVELASNGREALNKMSQHKFDLILMDLAMPEMDGYETIARIRNDEVSSQKETPIIVLTAQIFGDEKTRVIELGANGFLQKPYKTEDLLNAIKPYVKMKHNLDDGNKNSLDKATILKDFDITSEEFEHAKEEFLINIPKHLNSVQLAINNRKKQKVLMDLEKMKTYARNIGAKKIVAGLIRVVSRIELSKWEEAESIFIQLCSDLEEVFSYLKQES